MIHSQRTAEIDIMISISHCRRLHEFMSNVINKCECERSQCLQKYIKRVVGKRYFSWANHCTQIFVDKFSELALSIFFRILTHGYSFRKYQLPGRRKFTSNLLKISHLICVITSGSCLEKPRDFRHCFGLDIEATVEPGHRVKS